MKKNGNLVISGLFWTFGERITAQLVTTIVTIVLARILDPQHYGMISIVTVFITFCNVFVSAGFGSAVVQKKEVDDLDFNTAFAISLTMSILLYILVFFVAPFISYFYEMPELTLVIRVMGIRLIISSINTIQHAYIQRQMKFKKFFVSTLFGTVISAVVGIILAKIGFGVWALVAQYLTNTTIDTIVLLFVCKWKPKIQFNKSRAKTLFSFGWKVLITQLIFTLESDIRSLIVGKVFGSENLAYYDQGKKYPSLLVTNINSSLNKVMLPAFSKKQDNIDELKTLLRNSVRIGMYILSPILIGFAFIAKDFVTLLLTDKWLPAVPYIQIFCIVYLTRPLETACHQALLGLGKSGLVMKLMLCINIIAFITVLIAVFVFDSVLMVAIGSLLAALTSICLFMYETNKIIGYKFKEQIKDIYSPIIISLVMGGLVYVIGLMPVNILFKFILQVLVGMIIYILCSVIFKIDAFIFIKNKLLSIIKKKNVENAKA